MKKHRNIFIINDYVDPQKDAIYRILKNKKQKKKSISEKSDKNVK